MYIREDTFFLSCFIVLYGYKILKYYVIVVWDIGFSFQENLQLKIQKSVAII